jgi:hypothetical protein
MGLELADQLASLLDLAGTGSGSLQASHLGDMSAQVRRNAGDPAIVTGG